MTQERTIVWHRIATDPAPTNVELLVIYANGDMTIASVEADVWEPHDCVTASVDAPVWWASLLNVRPVPDHIVCERCGSNIVCERCGSKLGISPNSKGAFSYQGCNCNLPDWIRFNEQ